MMLDTATTPIGLLVDVVKMRGEMPISSISKKLLIIKEV